MESMEMKGYKGAQLNHFISNINIQPDHLYGFYDVDSKPDLQVFDYLQRIDQPSPIYQQYAIYNNNYTRLSALCMAGALYQSSWSIYFEANFSLEKKKSIRMKYLVGHGLFVKGEVFQQFGGFISSAIAEDLMFGYNLSEKGVPFKCLPYFEHSDFAESFPISVKQTSKWFAGEIELLKFTTVSPMLKCKRMLELSAWVLEPMMVVACVLLCVKSLTWFIPFFLFLCLVSAESILSNAKVKIFCRKRSFYFSLPFFYFIWYLFTPFGPIRALILILFKRNYIPYKTEKMFK